MRNHKGQANPERIQGPVQLEHIEAIEKSLWNAADTLRSDSNYASNEYFMPVMGLIFLRHAYSRYLSVKDGIEAGMPKRGGKARALSKEDFSRPERIAAFVKRISIPLVAPRPLAVVAKHRPVILTDIRSDEV